MPSSSELCVLRVELGGVIGGDLGGGIGGDLGKISRFGRICRLG